MKKEIYILTNKEEKGEYIINDLCDGEYLFFYSPDKLKEFYVKGVQDTKHYEITKVTIKIERGIEQGSIDPYFLFGGAFWHKTLRATNLNIIMHFFLFYFIMRLQSLTS